MINYIQLNYKLWKILLCCEDVPDSSVSCLLNLVQFFSDITFKKSEESSAIQLGTLVVHTTESASPWMVHLSI